MEYDARNGMTPRKRTMPRVVGIDHLVLSVGDFARSKEFYRKLLGFLGFKLKHDYAFEVASRNDVDALGAFLEEHGMTVVDPPGEYYGRSYYAVYFTDPDGMKLEAMVYKPPPKQRRARSEERRVGKE